MIKFGDQAEHLEQLAEDNPDRIPAALLSKPELPAELDDALEGFLILSRSRPIAATFGGVVYLPICASEAIAMAKVIGWPPIDFLRVIADADALYVEHLNQKTA